MRFADLDAVTVDGFGTLVTVADPTRALDAALRERGLVLAPRTIEEAFAAEVSYYTPRAAGGRDPQSLAALRLDCTRVFLESAGAALEPASFVEAFLGAIAVEPVPGAVETIEGLQARGLELAVVSNWDIGLSDHLERLGLDRLFRAIVTTAEAGADKPDPAVFRLALERIGVQASRALHVGDGLEDEQGAHAAGMRFAPAPLATALQGWT